MRNHSRHHIRSRSLNDSVGDASKKKQKEKIAEEKQLGKQGASRKRRWSVARQASRSLFAGCFIQQRDERLANERSKRSREGRQVKVIYTFRHQHYIILSAVLSRGMNAFF